MKLDVTFSENTKKLDVTFEQLKITPEGGYDHGYENGYENGYEAGYEQGKAIKMTTGTITFASNQTSVKITHNLGVKPTIFIIWITDLSSIPVSGSEGAKGLITKNFVLNYDNAGLRFGYALQGSTSSGVYNWAGYTPTITDNTITVQGLRAPYSFKVDYEYSWVAMHYGEDNI